jgi:phosphoadenosine phosphosulfate reductase family protein
MKDLKEIRIGWWSAGITSAVACKMALELYENVKLYYIDTGSAHEDNIRFKADCEKWYGQKIITVKNKKYKDVSDVLRKERYINGPDGAKCTKELKKQVRWDLEDQYKVSLFNNEVLVNQIFGFEFERNQINRAIRFLQQYPNANALFPLIEKGLSKNNCAGIILNASIELPYLYKFYNNNNCEGCVKGGMGYWNMVRVQNPGIFNQRAADERHVGHSCIKGVFLDELDPNAGRHEPVVLPNCRTFCDVDFVDLEDKSLDSIIKGEITIYEAAKKVA